MSYIEMLCAACGFTALDLPSGADPTLICTSCGGRMTRLSESAYILGDPDGH